MGGFSLLFSFVLFVQGAGAAYITLGADGAPYDINESIHFNGTIVSDTNNSDINFYVTDSNGNTLAAKTTYLGDRNSNFSIDANFPDAGDYNAFVVDLNHGVSTKMAFGINSFSDINMAFVSHLPPFNKGNSESIIVKFQALTTAGAPVNKVVRVDLVSPSGTILDTNADANANGLDNITFSSANATEGMNFISINSGFRTFPVPVGSFRVFADVLDDQNNPSEFFGRNKTAMVRVKLTNFDGNVPVTATSVSATATSPSGSSSTLTCAASGATNYCPYAIASNASAGSYTVSVTASYAGSSQTATRQFSVKTYSLDVSGEKFSRGFGGGAEKMPSVYPTNNDINLNVYVKNGSTGSFLTGSDLNNAFCSGGTIHYKIKNITVKDFNAVADANTYWLNTTDTNSYCIATLRTPSSSGTYKIVAFADVNGEHIEDGTILLVQNYLIFMNPVNPLTYDPSSPSGSFTFFEGQSVGFRPNYIDLNGTSSPKITSVNGAKLFTSTGTTDINSQMAYWRSDLNIVEIDFNSMTGIQGGFIPLAIIVDVNRDNNTNTDRAVTAFAAFKLSVFTVSVQTVDVNRAAKSSQMGPPAYKPDENVYLKVTATDGAGSAIAGASATVAELQNVDKWTSISSDANVVTDSNGVALLNLGKIGNANGSGGYFGSVRVTKPSGSTDTGEAFFMVKNFDVFGQPVSLTGGPECGFKQAILTDENVTLLLRAFEPGEFMGMGKDVNVFVPRTGAVYANYFGSPTKPQFPPAIVSVNYTISDMNCYAFGGGLPQVQDMNVLVISPASGKWQPGFYDFSINVTGTSGAFNGLSEVGRGFAQVQSFLFTAQQNGGSQFNLPTASPGSFFTVDLNTQGASRVFVKAALVDPEGQQKMEDETGEENDLNISLNSGASITSCASAGANCARFVDLNRDTNSSILDANTVKVWIPSNVKLQNYSLQLTAIDSSRNSSKAEIYMNMSLYNVVIPTLVWNSGILRTIPTRNVTANTAANILGSARSLWVDANNFGNFYDCSNQSCTANPYNGALDANILIDFTNRVIRVDGNGITGSPDLNFLNDANISVGQDFNSKDGNAYRLVDVSQVGTNGGAIKFIRVPDFNTKSSSMNYIDEYPVDRNFTVPILIQNPDGTPAQGAKVLITNMQYFVAGQTFPSMMIAPSCDINTTTPADSNTKLMQCTRNADFNSWAATADANGLALPVLKVHRPGSNMQLEIQIQSRDSNASKQRLQTWQGPSLTMDAYSTSFLETGPIFHVVYQPLTRISGLNGGVANPNDFNYYDFNYQANYNDQNGMGIIRLMGPSSSPAPTKVGRIAADTNGSNSVDGNFSATGRTWFFAPIADGNYYIDDDWDLNTNSSGATYYDTNVMLDVNYLLGAVPVAEREKVPELYHSIGLFGTQNGGFNFSFGESYPSLYLDINGIFSGVDSNILNNDINVYGIYYNPMGPNGSIGYAPSKNLSNMGIKVTVTNLDGTPLTGTASVSNLKITNFNTGASLSASESYSLINGVRIIPLGSPIVLSSGQGLLSYDLNVNGIVSSIFDGGVMIGN